MTRKELPYKMLGIDVCDYNESIACYKAQNNLDEMNRTNNRFQCGCSICFCAFGAGHWKVVHEWSKLTISDASEYLLGDWQYQKSWDGEPIEAGYFEKSPSYWDYVLEAGLGWGSVGRHWNEVTRLLSFPSEMVVPDEDAGLTGLAYYRGLSRWWNDRSDFRWTEEVKQIRGRGSKTFQLLSDIVCGISERSTEKLQKAFPKFVEYFVKRRDHNEQFPMAAIFLWNVAKMDRMIVNLHEDVAKFLFELPEEFWAGQA